MIVTLDGEKLAGPIPAGRPLHALLDDLRRTHARGRLIVSVAVDGREMLGDELDLKLSETPAEDAQIDLESADAAQLAAESLREVARLMGAAEPGCIAISERINSGDAAGGLSEIGAYVELWQSCRQAVLQCCDVLGRDLTGVEIEGQRMLEHLTIAAAKLTELRDALDARDFVLVSDLLRFEFGPLSRQWETLLGALADATLADR